MKHLLVTALVSLMPFMAQALVADSFECKLKITDSISAETDEQRLYFNIARLPLSRSPAPDVRITTGTSSFDNNFRTQKYTITTSASLYYSHAVKVNSNGQVQDARQKTCVIISGSACSKSGGTPNAPCFIFQAYCPQSIHDSDPFDPASGWSQIATSGNEPLFQERDLTTATQKIYDENKNAVGEATFSCKFRGTYQ